jgi:flagellar biosynthesis/type III secretory pathway protein FliH
MSARRQMRQKLAPYIWALLDYFVGKRDNPEYRPKAPQKFKHVDEVLKMLSAFTGDSRFSDFITQEGGRPVTMCEVLDRAENKGREDGIKKGEENARLEAIRNIMKNLHVTAQQAMDVLEIPKEDWPMYEERL